MASIATANTTTALTRIKTAFRAHQRIRKLNPYQFDYEHGQWWITHKPTGAVWSVVDSEPGPVNFEPISYGDDF